MTGRVVVVVPMRNEREAVGPLGEKFAAVLPRLGANPLVLVVDGQSSDGTPDLVRGWADRVPVEIVSLREDRGLGGALDAGLRRALEAGAGTVVTMDGDDSHDPATIPSLLDRLAEGADVVVASRFAPGGREVGVAVHRRLLSHGAGRFLRTLFPTGEVRDYSSGFRAYRASALERVQDAYGSIVDERGFTCMLELLLRLRSVDARAAEVPLVLRYDLKRSESKMSVGRTILRTLRVAARHRLPGSRRARPSPSRAA